MTLTIHHLLDEVRTTLGPRLAAAELDAAFARGALVVDTRPEAQRRRDGELPGAIVIERNVLEWRLDPTSAARISPGGCGRHTQLSVSSTSAIRRPRAPRSTAARALSTSGSSGMGRPLCLAAYRHPGGRLLPHVSSTLPTRHEGLCLRLTNSVG